MYKKQDLNVEKKKIDSYVAIGAFIDEIIRELVVLNSDEKVANFLESIAKKGEDGVYRKK